MELVKLVGFTDAELEDIVAFMPCILAEGGTVVMLASDWADIEDVFSHLTVEYVTI